MALTNARDGGMPPRPTMTFEILKRKIKAGELDTIIVVAPDVFGRLVGKRFTAEFFLNQVARHGTHGCNYLLTVNVEMDPMDGFKLASWEKGFGDFEMRPDLSSIRALPWQPGAAMVLCDFHHDDGEPVLQAPRSVHLHHELAAEVVSRHRSGLRSLAEVALALVFAQRGFRWRALPLAGRVKAGLEWTLVCVSYNLKRLFVLKNVAGAA